MQYADSEYRLVRIRITFTCISWGYAYHTVGKPELLDTVEALLYTTDTQEAK